MNQSQSFIGNGTRIAGLNAVSAVNASLRLGSSTFTGFDTGVNVSNFFGSFVEMTGGSINALVTGIRTDVTGGGSTILSQAAIVAPTGIHSTNTDGTTITTSGAGTINSTSAGTGTGIIATSSGGTNAVTVNVGAAIGTTTAHGVGVLASTTGTSTGAINITTTAAIVATGRAISATAGTFGNTGAITLGGNVTGATGVYTNFGDYAVGIGAGVTVTSTGNGSTNAALYLINGTNTVTNNGALVATGTGSHGVHFSSDGLVTNTATGTITGSTGIWYQNVASVTNAGTITGTGGTGTAGVYGSSGASVTNTGTITGYDGVYSGGNPTVHNNTGGTITGVLHGYNLNGGRFTLTNTGVINTAGGTGGAGLSGLRLNTTLSPNTITNSGAITGGGDATYGFGVEIVDGAVTLTNQSGGVITGGIGGIWLASDDLATLNLNLGSTVTGQILSTSTGARTATIAGLLDGAYNAAGASGVDTLTLASTGSITGAVTLGAGDDVFNWQRGTFTTVNAGTGAADTFNSALGAGVSGSLSLSKLSNFDSYNHQSGNLTLTGTRATGPGWTLVPGSSLTLDGSLTATTGTGYGITMNGNGSPATVTILTGATLNGYVGVWFNTGGANTFSNAGTVTGSNTGLLTNGALTATNTGTITAGTGAAFSTGVSVSTMTNSGILTGGSDGTTGFGAYSAFTGLNFTNLAGGVVSGGAGGISAGTNTGATGLLTVSNASGGQIGGPVGITTGQASRLTLSNDGNVTGTNGAIAAAGTGATSITNNATGRIVSTGDAYAISTGGATTITNAGVIGTGTVTSGGVYTPGGSYTAIRTAAAGTIRNSGLIDGQSGGILADGALDLRNTGAINALGLGNGLSKDAAFITGTATVLNAGLMSAGVYSAIVAQGANSVITNAAAGTLQGGSDAIFGEAVQLGGTNATFVNYGAASSAVGRGVLAGDGGATINLHAGSTTGDIQTGGGNDILALYSGRGSAGAAAVDGASGITLQNAGVLAAATVGTVNLGGGTDTLQLRGTGDDSANGAAGTLDLGGSTVNTAEVLTKLDNGAWTLTGAAAVPGMTINAGMGGSAGLLIFSGTGLTGDINVNGATVRATTTTAFGAGTLHMIDPTIQFAATGTYANDISLEVVNGQQANDPTLLRNISGGTITLSGRIYETAGVGGANQYVAFDGGTTLLSNTGNIWGGVTTINSGTTLSGAFNTISGGSITNNGQLTYTGGAGTVAQNITGTGSFTRNGTGSLLLTGTNNWTGTTTIQAGELRGTTASISGASIINNGTLTYVNTTAGTASQAISGSGAINILGTAATTLSGAITTTGQLTVSGAGAGLILGGARSGSSNTGAVVSGAGASLTVANGASILSGQYNGVRLDGTNTTLTNLSLIQNAGTGGDGTVGAGAFVVDAAGTTTTINNGSVSDTGAGSTIRGFNAGIRHDNSALGTLVVNNYGRVLGDVYNGIENTNGLLTLNNFAGGEIYTLLGNGVSSASAGAVTVTNAGVIGRDIANTQTVGGYGVVTNGALTLVNQTGGLITGSLGGVSAASSASITNAGSITGAGAGSYGVSMTAGGSVTNQSAGSITGVSGGLLLSGGAAFTLNLQAGSTTGLVRSTASGTVTTTVAGSLTGAYVAAGAGVDNLTLAGAGSMTSASLGAGADSFVYEGGAFSGLVDAGTGTDSFTSNLSGGAASVNLSNLANFETFTHQSGALTLTGTGAFSGGSAIQGGSLIVSGTLQSAASVANGATLSGGGSITGAVSVADGGVLTGVHGSTLTMGSLGLLSGSTINATFSSAGGPALFAVTGDLTLDGTVNVASTGAYGFGVYGLMTYGGVLTNNGLVIGATPGGVQRVGVQTSVAGQVNIVHAPTELLFWDGGAVGQHNNGAVNGGSGTWTAAGSEWTDANGQFNGAMEPQPGFAIFQGAGGVVTVDDVNGAVGVTGMQFAANGYRIEGDSITLANPGTTIRVGDGTAPSAAWAAAIASTLTGTGGLVKTDLGTLILAGDSDYTGGTTVNAGTLQIGEGGTAGSILGSVALANNSTLIFSRTDNHVFVNDVSGAGSVGVNGFVTLSGAITATGGVDVYANSAATLSNVSVASGAAVSLAANADVTVASRGAVSSLSGNGIYGVGGNAVLNLGGIQSDNLTVRLGAGGSLDNAGSITTTTSGNAVWFDSTGSINNQAGGVIAAAGATNQSYGAVFVGAGSVVNSGLISGGFTGLALFGGGTVANLSGGEIRGATGVTANVLATVTNAANATIASTTGAAVRLVGSGSSVTNAGVISAGSVFSAVYFDGVGAVTNQAGGSISNIATAVQFVGAGSVLDNAGAISNTNTNAAVYFNNTGTVTNRATGTVSSTNGYGVQFAGANASVTNFGSITAGQRAVSLDGANSTLINAGSITGGNAAVLAAGGSATNSGSMIGTGGSGLALSNGGVVDNQLNGLIRGATNGVNGSAGMATVTNAGAITGLNGAGVRLAGGGSVDNLAGGAIGGTTGAIVSAGSFVDAISLRSGSTISGGLSLAGGADTLTLYAGAATSGVLDGGDGIDAFTVAGAGSSSFDIGTLINFESRSMNGAGTFTLTGVDASTAAWALNSGTLAASGGSAVNDAARINIAGGGSLALLSDETIGALAGSGFVDLGSSRLILADAQTTTYAGVVRGAGGLTVGSAYGLTLTGANSYTGATVVDGVLTLGVDGVLADGSNLLVNATGMADLQGFNETVNDATISGVLNGAGTLTAGVYILNGATINASLGAGTLSSTGVSTLNGTSNAGLVLVTAGTLVLGASDRLSDAALVGVSTGATLNLQGFNDTITTLDLNGTLAGSGTLTANTYFLRTGSLVNANLGAGQVRVNGDARLNGTAAATSVVINTGTLTLGASNRLADAATLFVASGAALNLGAFNETVGLALLNGTLAGTGTLTAGEYQLNGATINANLGAGNLFNTGGVSTLNGTSGAANVAVQAGTLSLGASNRLADNATVSVAAGSILNLNAFNDTVGLAILNGTLNGAGTLTAVQYQLNGATVNANLGAGPLLNMGGVSTLTGTAAASQVLINAGALRLGANERLSDAATVSVGSGATFNLNGFNERIGALFGTGDVNVGAGRLTFGGVESGFGGRLSGSGSLVHTGGLFTLMGDHTVGAISNTGGELRFLGATTGGLSASGGSVTGAGTIGGALTASNGAILSPGLAGVQNGIGGFTAGGLTLNGATLAIDVLGRSGGNLIDQLRINGAANLTGGLLNPTFQGSAATDFDFSTRYLFLQANNLVGTFANGGTFTAAAQPGLYWRVRYDLSPNAAVLELRELTSFDPGATGTGNQRAVGQALSGGQLAASDDWAAILSLIAGLSPADQAAAFDSISGEPLADVTTSLFSANDSFLTAVRDGGLGGRDDGGEALNFVDRMSFVGGRENGADRLGDVLGAFDPSASAGRGAGGWVSAYAGDQTLDGKPGQATVESTLNGFAGGYGVRNGALSVGAAGGVTRLEGDVAARQGHYESDLSHAAGYVAFDDGAWAADLTASFYGGDLDTRRGLTVGAFRGQAIGNTHVEGQALSASVARRFQVSDNTMIALGAIGTASSASVDGYTETGAGGLSLQASGMERDWQSLQLSARGTQDYRVNGHGFRIYAGAGVMATAGDRQATGDMRFSGAPIGFGTFAVEGAEAPPLAGLVDFGLEVGAGEGVTVSAGYRGLFSERLQDNQVGVKLKVNW